MLTSKVLGEHEIPARVITKIILLTSGVKPRQSDALMFSLWVDWLLRPAGQRILSLRLQGKKLSISLFLNPIL